MATADSRSILASNLWERTGDDTLSRRAFLGLTGGLTLYGLALNAVIAAWALQAQFRPGTILFLVLGLALPMAGVFTANRA